MLLAVNPALSVAQERSSQESSSKQQQTDPAPFPDSPSMVRVQGSPENQSGSAGQTSASETQKPQPPTEVQQNRKQQPVGTAVAEPANTAGIAASEPAGVAIAPAKQHRTRVLLIKVGALVGAGVAVGTVMALSKASPSKPPGAP